jgi:3-hydroxyacyl-[acyl-carrier-protein] dehydratase
MILEAKQINKILRQKFPFVMIDRVLEIDPGKFSKAIKNITQTEPCFQGHFPDEPIFPGVLILEAMAQAGGFIFVNGNSEQKGYIAAIDKVKFIKPVIPGDTLTIECRFVAALQGISRVNCQVKVESQIVAKGEITYKLEGK